MTNEKIYVGIDDQVIEAKGQILQDLLEFQEQCKKEKEIETANMANLTAAKAAAQAKLAALGLTIEDLQALGL